MRVNASKVRAGALQTWALAKYVVHRFQRDDATRMAASLSYTSLLSLVPLMAIALAMLAAFPVFDGIRDQIQDWVFKNFVPAVGAEVQKQVGRFIRNAGKLTAAGVVGLAFTAIMLLVTIEGAMNQVFRVARERSPISKLLVYWTVVTLGPLLMGLSLSLQGYLTAASKWVGKSATTMLTAPVPTILSMLAFMVLYAAVPNRPVRIRDAAIGGIVGGLLFAVLRWAFGLYITSSDAYTNVYGAVAVIPIFLLWMFLSWMAVLVGAELTAALPEWRAGYHEGDRHSRGARRLTLALEVLAALFAAARAAKGEGGGEVSRGALLKDTAVAERELMPVLQRLIETGFVAPTANKRYLLARDLGSASLDDLVVAMQLDLSLDDSLATESPWRQAVQERVTAAREAAGGNLATDLSTLLRQADRPESPAT